MLLSTLLAGQLILFPFLTSQKGNCQDNNLIFTALRFNKLILPDGLSGEKQEARFILYLHEDGTYLGRYSESQVITCQNTPQGEMCQLKPLISRNFKGHWEPVNNKVQIENLGTGIIDSYNTIPILKFHFESEEFVKINGQDKTGWMVEINLDEQGRTTQKICSST